VKYSETGKVHAVQELKHPLIREALKLTGTRVRGLEIASMSDIPAGSGLGSCGSFTTALLCALYAIKHEIASKRDLAEMACHIELDLLGGPIGKQDRFIASYGGITCFELQRDDRAAVMPLRLDAMARHNLEENLMLFSPATPEVHRRSSGTKTRAANKATKPCLTTRIFEARLR
jgi:D-glycero-alpha-D-manno-heptose-7-phosphate kinase